jgi:RimJ/RimL family protein N-acetyltransferase
MEVSPKFVIDDIDYTVSGKMPHKLKTPTFELHRTHYENVNLNRIHSLFSDLQDPDEVFQYCGWSYHSDIDETREFLDKRTRQWMDEGMYSYVISVDNEYAGTTYIDIHQSQESATFGLWLRKKFWGNNLHGRVTDARVHISFNELNLKYIDVGCLDYNDKSLRSIAEYIDRYGGSYYGSPLVSYSKYGGENKLVPHHEFVVTEEQYKSQESGLSTTIPSITWSDTELYERLE